ncbi:lia operon protein LiaF [Amphibacillus marinus]|uniref:Lia operon protein LiaF n=1 Tax=Amphibacillus marinus TaxID=872970 RepID=A0A1H8MWU8_9BACI|nr:cell wall-active antibiotics response protein LiaF [Amphibacillus marinus]SEO21759.1 lia operon protein LiaF [Amphibacillus marinus]
MFNEESKKWIQYSLLAIVALFIIEFVFLGRSFIWLLIWGVLVYLSWQYYYRPEGRVMFWISVVALCITLMDTIFFRLAVAAVFIGAILYVYQHRRTQLAHSRSLQFGEEPIEQEELLFSNQWFGRRTTGKRPYQWQDINSQVLVGETVIDLNQTVLPKGEPIIVVHHAAGTIRIVVPYDVEVSIHHSVFAGSVDIFGYGDDRLTNRTVHYQTKNYREAKQRVKIYTSMLIGKIEVRRG